MANVRRNLAQAPDRRFESGIWVKLAVSLVFCMVVRMIAAQAPPPDAPVKEEMDAQNYKYQVPKPELRKSRTDEQKYRGQVRGILNGAPITDPATRQTFRGFYQTYLFPMMTTEEGMRTIGTERLAFLRDLQNAKNNEARRELVELTLPAMTKIVQDPAYRPAARYNAMLIIANLNDVEPNALGSTPTLPEPMKAALPTLLQQFQKSDRDEIKLAALIGLSRHLEWDNYKQSPNTQMPPAGRAAIIKELVSLAEAKEAPAGRAADVHEWMRRRAIEALSMACLTKPDADIAALMERLLRDEAEPLTVRLAVATALGRMSLQAPTKIDPVATAKDLGYIALKATESELSRAETNRKAELEHEARLAGTYQGDQYLGGPGGMPGMPGRPGMLSGEGGGGPGGVRPLRPQPGMPGGGGLDGGMGLGGEMGLDPSLQDPKKYEVDLLRRRLRQNLYAVQLGLLGGEDHTKPKPIPPGGKAATSPTTAATAGGSGGEKKEPRGMFAIAKSEPEKKQVDEVYFAVRDVAEAVESAGTDAEFYQLLKDVRRHLKPLESVVGRRAPPPGATAVSDDVPAAGGKAAKKGGPPPKGLPPKGKPAVAPKTTTGTTPKSQPNVFAQPPRR